MIHIEQHTIYVMREQLIWHLNTHCNVTHIEHLLIFHVVNAWCTFDNHTGILHSNRVDTIHLGFRLSRWQQFHIIPLEARHSAWQHKGMMLSVLWDESHYPLDVLERVGPCVVAPSARPLSLGTNLFAVYHFSNPVRRSWLILFKRTHWKFLSLYFLVK